MVIIIVNDKAKTESGLDGQNFLLFRMDCPRGLNTLVNISTMLTTMRSLLMMTKNNILLVLIIIWPINKSRYRTNEKTHHRVYPAAIILAYPSACHHSSHPIFHLPHLRTNPEHIRYRKRERYGTGRHVVRLI